MQSERDKFLSQIAALHAEHEGAALRTELEQIKSADTPSLDKKVRGQIFRIKYKVHIRTASVIAACLVLALMLPQVLWQMQPGRVATAPAPAPAAPAAMPEAAMAMPDAVMDWDDDLAEPRAGGAGEPFGVYSGEAAPAAQEEEQAVGEVAYDVTDVGEWHASPFLFNLPDGFHLLSSMRRGLAEGAWFITYELIYGHDDQMITLTLQQGQALQAADDYSLNAMQVNGHTVYYQQSITHGVSIHFEKDYVFYRLHSWDAELETLIILSQAILDS